MHAQVLREPVRQCEVTPHQLQRVIRVIDHLWEEKKRKKKIGEGNPGDYRLVRLMSFPVKVMEQGRLWEVIFRHLNKKVAGNSHTNLPRQITLD